MSLTWRVSLWLSAAACLILAGLAKDAGFTHSPKTLVIAAVALLLCSLSDVLLDFIGEKL